MSGLVQGVLLFILGCIVTYGLVQSVGGAKKGNANHGHGGGAHGHH